MIIFVGSWMSHGKMEMQDGVTNVGVFQITKEGMMLIKVMPGVDIKRDILDFSPMKIVMAKSMKNTVVDRTIVTGEGFHLQLEDDETFVDFIKDESNEKTVRDTSDAVLIT